MNALPMSERDEGEAIGVQGVELLAPDLACFSTKPSGSLADISALRRDTAEFVRRRGNVSLAGATVRDRTIGGNHGNPEIGVRIYQPEGASQSPALLHCHGGAFVLGSPALDDPLCLVYAAAAQCTVVSVDYRLAPEHPFPAGLEDCYTTLLWIASAGADGTIDATRLAVSGSSAGGALAASVAQLARDRSGPALCLQMLVYPVLDDRLSTASMTTFTRTPVFARPVAREMWAHYLQGRPAGPNASPARADSLARLPPAYVEAAELDPLRDEAIEYAKRLETSGVPVELHIVAGAPHGFDQDYLGAPAKSATADRMLALRTAALRSAFYPP